MSTRLDWQLDGPEAPVEVAVAPQVSQARPPWRPSTLVVVIYLGAVVGAGAMGFELGRWSMAESERVESVTNQLALEELAWRRGDAGLFQATLDPHAPDWWRARELQAFQDHAPTLVTLRLAGRPEPLPDNPTTAAVDVEITAQGSARIERRTYRRVSTEWLRAPSS